MGDIEKWLKFAKSAPKNAKDIINGHLSNKTYMVGHAPTPADIAVMEVLEKINFIPDMNCPHVSRWYYLMKATSPIVTSATVSAPKVGTNQIKGAAKKTDMKKEKEEIVDEGGVCPPLENAVDGKVCTRFPPEPSGYLHIGHCKAVLLNQYYALRYHGRLLIRFDDTNPSKEKEEYEDNILTDLETLGVKTDVVSHTSDHFEKCQQIAKQLIKEGIAYMDDTPQEQMQSERMSMINSKKRETSVEENMKLFESLMKGEKESQMYCLRAKIDMQSVNGTMRDPVLYRYNETPHHRTGTKYKAYPTYDMACPIVDSIEGVTHALRTTEYNDRDEQYHWLQRAMKLREVNIYSFGKMNFIHTVLSKRKLNWFVEKKLVDGWSDPRFPTIQGCVRRGMEINVLKNFILMQGASRRVITMEWDKFWSENKKALEETSSRYMAIDKLTAVPFIITNMDISTSSVVSVQIHPQKPELGYRAMRRSNRLLLEGEDAVLLREGEEVTLLRWGNFFIDKINKNEEGKIIDIQGRTHPEAKNFSKTKKLTWLADVPEIIEIKMIEFGHLITKQKLLDTENFTDYINPCTKYETIGYGDACLRTIQQGQVIQLERKGFFRCDVTYCVSSLSLSLSPRPIVLFQIPDGRVKATSPVSTALLVK